MSKLIMSISKLYCSLNVDIFKLIMKGSLRVPQIFILKDGTITDDDNFKKIVSDIS